MALAETQAQVSQRGDGCVWDENATMICCLVRSFVLSHRILLYIVSPNFECAHHTPLPFNLQTNTLLFSRVSPSRLWDFPPMPCRSTTVPSEPPPGPRKRGDRRNPSRRLVAGACVIIHACAYASSYKPSSRQPCSRSAISIYKLEWLSIEGWPAISFTTTQPPSIKYLFLWIAVDSYH